MIDEKRNNEVHIKIREYCHDNSKYYIDFLKKLVLKESPSNDPITTKEILNIIAAELDVLDCTCEYTPGSESGGYLIAHPKIDNEKHQILIGHTDTVWPVGTLKQMPFETDKNIIHGPGTFDMKAGVANMVLSIKALRDLEIKPGVLPLYLFTTDEEVGSGESRNIIEKLAESSTRAFVMEPALGPIGKLKTRRKGVGHFDIVVKGKAAHAGLDPEAGASAILGLSHIIQDLFAMNNVEKGITVNVGTIDGGLRSNVIAPECKAAVDVRVMTWSDAERIEEAIYALQSEVEGVTVEVSGHVDRMPMESTDRNVKLWEKAKTIGDELGMSLKDGLSGGASDGNFTSQYTPTLDGLGAVGDGAHALHEHIIIDSTIDRAALLTSLILSD